MGRAPSAPCARADPRPSRRPPGPAGQALKKNITTLGPLVLPLSEQLAFAANMLARKLYGSKRVKQYVPNFKKAFDHICIHTGEAGGWERVC